MPSVRISWSVDIVVQGCTVLCCAECFAVLDKSGEKVNWGSALVERCCMGAKNNCGEKRAPERGHEDTGQVAVTYRKICARSRKDCEPQLVKKKTSE